MKRTTQKELRQYIRLNLAQNISNADFETVEALRASHTFTVELVSRGIYGMNGALLSDESGNCYAIVGRTSALFQLV